MHRSGRRRYWDNIKRRILRKWRSINPRKRVVYSKAATDVWNIFLGSLSIAFPDIMYIYLPYVMGGMMALAGAASLALGIRRHEYKRTDTRLTASGIISILIGLIIVIQNKNSYGLVGVFWGVNGLQRSIGELNETISRIANKRKGWQRLMFFAVFGLVISILLLLNPLEGVYEHMTFIGLELIFIGLDQIDEIFFED